MENITVKQRNITALKYGLIIGVIYCVLFSVINLLMANIVIYNVMRAVVYIFYMTLIGVFLTQIKKSDGGFLEFKDALGAAFVMILVGSLIYFIYSYIYFEFIDPHFLEKMKVSVVTYMENKKVPDEAIESTVKKFDEEIADSKSFHLGKTLLGYFGFLVLDTLFAMIVCLIVKKQRPIFS